MVALSNKSDNLTTSILLVLRIMEKKAKKLSQSQRHRLQFIESSLIWEGSVQRRDVCEAFELTPNHLTRDITSYRKEFKHNLVYDTETRAWRPGPEFRPAYASDDPEVYLSLLHAFVLSGEASVMTKLGPTAAAQTIPAVVGKIERDILKEVIGAIRDKTGLIVRYQSFSDVEPVERTIWPHTMVYANERWHVRAYDSRRQQFRDFVLTRIVKAKATDITTPSAMIADTAWQKEVSLQIVPTPTMSESQQQAVIREFGMRRLGDTWVWKVTMRQCLIGYFLHQHRLDLPAHLSKHRRIALKDPEIAKTYAFVDD